MSNWWRDLRFALRMLARNPGLTATVLLTLGLERGQVVRLVVREGAVLAGIGLALGLVSAYFVGRAMQSMLFGVHALDVTAFSAVGGILLAAAATRLMQVLRTG